MNTITIPKEDVKAFCSGQYLTNELPPKITDTEILAFIAGNLCEAYEEVNAGAVQVLINMDVNAMMYFLSRYGITVE